MGTDTNPEKRRPLTSQEDPSDDWLSEPVDRLTYCAKCRCTGEVRFKFNLDDAYSHKWQYENKALDRTDKWVAFDDADCYEIEIHWQKLDGGFTDNGKVPNPVLTQQSCNQCGYDVRQSTAIKACPACQSKDWEGSSYTVNVDPSKMSKQRISHPAGPEKMGNIRRISLKNPPSIIGEPLPSLPRQPSTTM